MLLRSQLRIVMINTWVDFSFMISLGFQTAPASVSQYKICSEVLREWWAQAGKGAFVLQILLMQEMSCQRLWRDEELHFGTPYVSSLFLNQ